MRGPIPKAIAKGVLRDQDKKTLQDFKEDFKERKI